MLRHVPDLESRSLRWMELGTWQSRRDARSMLRLRVMIDYLLPRKDGQRASGSREARRQALVMGDVAVAFYKFGMSRAEWKEFQDAIAASHADACALLPATVVLSSQPLARPSLARTVHHHAPRSRWTCPARTRANGVHHPQTSCSETVSSCVGLEAHLRRHARTGSAPT